MKTFDDWTIWEDAGSWFVREVNDSAAYQFPTEAEALSFIDNANDVENLFRPDWME